MGCSYTIFPKSVFDIFGTATDTLQIMRPTFKADRILCTMTLWEPLKTASLSACSVRKFIKLSALRTAKQFLKVPLRFNLRRDKPVLAYFDLIALFHASSKRFLF